MNLTPVRLEQLSALVHEVRLSEVPKFGVPKFKVISYQGEYRAGTPGRADAQYILATAAAAHEAWFTEGIAIDFSRLRYVWGDEMEWVLKIGQRPPIDCRFPLAIIVGPESASALRTLLARDFDDYCVDSLDGAVRLIDIKCDAFNKCVAAWKPTPSAI